MEPQESKSQLDESKEQTFKEVSKEKLICFVIMPISDHPEYAPGHFARVYKHIIRPACEKAGFIPIRADEVSGTNMIVIDILQKIVNSPMAVCDLSTRNPNVLYELGIRQSFDLPVTLMKDDVTDRIFDIQGFRDVFYTKALRIDEVSEAVDKLAISLRETYDNKGKDVNSIVELMGITKAHTKAPIQITPDTEILLNAITDISHRLAVLERPKSTRNKSKEVLPPYLVRISDGSLLQVGERVIHNYYGEGEIESFQPNPFDSSIPPLLKVKFANQITMTIDPNDPALISHPDNPLPF